MVKIPEDKIPGNDLRRKDKGDPGKDAGSEHDAGWIKPVSKDIRTWHGLLDRIRQTIPASGTNVGGMTPGMPKACQTGWFEPSGYRLDVHAGV
jgi:hypothetical protein